MRVLIGGEFNGKIRDAFRRLGHDAWSCDFRPTAVPGPHYRCDWWNIIPEGWDLAIFHPTCTFMANSGAKHLFLGMKKENGLNEERWLAMGRDAWNFWRLLNCKIERVCLENPVMLGYAQLMVGVKPQIIHPWEHGHRKMKATALWLKNLPRIAPTNNVGPPPSDAAERYKWQDVFRMAPTADPEIRRMARSETYQGIADAFADQWGGMAFQNSNAA